MAIDPDLPKSAIPTRRPARRRWLFRLVAVALGVVLALVAAEAALRVMGYGDPVRYAASPTRLWRLEPSQDARIPGTQGRIHINAAGVRGPERSVEKAPGVCRVITYGDSVTFGIQVDDLATFPAFLEKALVARRPSDRFEVWNAGVPAYATEQEVRYWAEEGVALRPDVVVIAFCANDWIPTVSNDEWLSLEQQESLAFRMRLRSVALLDFLRLLVGGRRSQLSGADGTCDRRVIDLESPRDRTILTQLETTLESARRLSEKAGTRLLLVFLPEKCQVDGSKPPTPLRSLGSSAERMGIAVLDLIPAFAASPAGVDGLFAAGNDHLHFTVEGNRVVAESIAKYIERSGWLP